MGMNMVSKGVQNVLDFLQSDFPDMDIIGISGKVSWLNRISSLSGSLAVRISNLDWLVIHIYEYLR